MREAEPNPWREEAVEIPDGDGGTVRFNLRLPSRAGARPLPVLIILAGIKTSERTLEKLPDFGENALIAYAYPYDRGRWRSVSIVERALDIHRMTRALGPQVDALVNWVKAQPWSDPERVNLAGGSLGCIVLPAILREMQARGTRVRCAILGYGGVGRFTLAYVALRRRSRLLGLLGGTLSWMTTAHVDPARHLPHIAGDFLVITSPDDELIPRRCTLRLERMTPEPKEIVHLRGRHADAAGPALLGEVVGIARDWLARRGAFNP